MYFTSFDSPSFSLSFLPEVKYLVASSSSSSSGGEPRKRRTGRRCATRIPLLLPSTRNQARPRRLLSSPLSLSRLNHRTSEQSYSDDDRRSGSSVGKFFSRASVHPLAARSYRNSSIGAEGRQERRRVGREEGEKIRGRELRRKTVDYVCLTTSLPLTSERPGVMFEHEK